MNIAIDCFLCLLALFILIKYTVKGFVGSLFGALKLILSIAAACILTPLIFGSGGLVETVIAYLLVFFASYVVFAITAFVVEKIFELPVLKTLNKLLGFALGAVSAYIVLSITVSVISMLLAFSSTFFGISAEELRESTQIYKFFIDSGILPNIGK